MFKALGTAAASSLFSLCLLLPTQVHGQPPKTDEAARAGSAAAAAKAYADISLIGVHRKTQLSGDLKAVEILDPLGWADSLFKEGRYQEALTVINGVLRKDPKSGAAYARRSGILINLSQFEGAVADGELGIKLSTTPRDKSRSAYNMCAGLTFLDKKSEALKACTLSLSFDPKSSWAHFGLGKIYYFLGMWKESGTALDRSLALNPRAPAALAYRAEVHFLSGEIEKGMVHAQKAVELGPNDYRSFRARAIGYELSHRFEEMLADATRALELGPNIPLNHLMRGKALGLLGRYDEALAEYTVEPDRKAVEPYLAGLHYELYGSRIYNPGACSSEVQTPLTYNSNAFDECKKKIVQALQESAEPQSVAPPTKRTPPGLPKRQIKK
jgi:tetratricopeptide (TPR) repeat protein